MIILYDERERGFEILGLEAIKQYLGKGFEDCQNDFDIDEKLQAQNNGIAGYRCEDLITGWCETEDIKIGEVYTLSDLLPELLDDSFKSADVLRSSFVSTEEAEIEFEVVQNDGIFSAVKIINIKKKR